LREEVVTMDQRLVFKFKIDGEGEWYVKGADRISVDGGRLTLIEHPTWAFETIPLFRVEALSIQSVSSVHKRAFAV
jgi:hypothetical protein